MNSNLPLRFNGPAVYRLTVQGKLARSLLDSFNGISISEQLLPEGVVISIIFIRIKDQAELSGILNTIYEWRFPLISVDCNDSHLEGAEK